MENRKKFKCIILLILMIFQNNTSFSTNIEEYKAKINNDINLFREDSRKLNYLRNEFKNDSLEFFEKQFLALNIENIITSSSNLCLDNYLYLDVARFYNANNRPDKYFEILKNLYHQTRLCNDDSIRVEVLKYLGNYFGYRLGEYDKAKIYHHEIFAIYRRNKDYKSLTERMISYSNFYFNVGNINFSFKIIKDAIEIAKQHNIKNFEKERFADFGDIYRALGKYDNCKFYYKKAIEFAEQEFKNKKSNVEDLATLYCNYSLVFALTKEYSEQKYWILKAVELCEKNNEARIKYEKTKDYLTYFYFENKDYKNALDCSLQALAFYQRKKDSNSILDLYSVLIEIYEKMNDSKNQALYFKKYFLLKDSLAGFESEKKIKQIEFSFLEEANQSKIKSIEQEKLTQEKLKKIYSVCFIISLILLSLSLYFYFQIKLVKQKIAIQNTKLEQKNTEILDSIEYAKRIQTAILPPPRIVKEFLKNSFILYLPKDIVAGDFYWMESVDDKIYFAACDCTGHGVPGAMVSVVCNTALSRSLNEFGLRNTGEIFDQTRALVLDNFAKSDEEVQDGMDASLAALDVTTRKLMWSGANNPLWIYRKADKTIQEIKADKQPIGKGYNNTPFSSHELSLYEGDIIYLFTDGYADQFGGERGKKLTKAKFREKLLSIATLTMEEQRKELLNFHDSYRGGLAQVDDICVIGVRV